MARELGQRPLLYGPTVDDLQRHFAQLGGAIVSKLTFPAPDTSVKTEDKKLSPEVTVRIYTPAGYTGGRPAGLFMHGGGWVFGDSESEDGFCRQIAKDAGVVLVSVDYRLAPKHRYPAALDDCITAYRWVVENAGYLNVIKGKIFTIGGSAGGGLALATSPRLIDEGLGDSVKGVVALVPVTVHLDACPENLKPTYTAYQENANSTINTASAMLTFFEAYGASPTDTYTSPLLHTKLTDLPKTYIVTASLDTLRDDGRLLKKALEVAGVEHKVDEYEGYPHWFWTFPSKHLEPINKEFMGKLREGIEFVLS